ncbi:MAG TPA: tetratricopeptide repeat protein [Crenotrichaceae bacterium]|nr:tetratricopeptide repeat protein [Crenotrichaceae bacterium]
MQQPQNNISNSVERLYQQASWHFQHGGINEAEALTRKVLMQNNDHPDANHLLGLIAIHYGKHAQAIQLIERAIQLKPLQVIYFNALSSALHKEGRLKDALAVNDKILKQKPRLTDAHNNRSLLLRKLGRLEEALAASDKAIKLKPQQARAHLNRALALKEMERIEDSLASFERAIRLNPKFTEAYNQYAIMLRNLGRTEDSLAACDKAIKLNPHYVEAYNNRTVALMDQGREPEALITSSQAAQIDPHSAIAQYNLGLVLLNMGRTEEALPPCQQAVNLKPQYAPAHYNLGLVLKDMMRSDEAIAACKRAIELDPQSAKAWLNISAIYIDMGRNQDALHACEQAVKLDPQSAKAHANLGRILMDLGHPEAFSSLQTALKLDPDITVPSYLLAILGHADAPEQSPSEYVVSLFDDYANRFDQHLVNDLEYRAPEQLFHSITALLDDPSQKFDILDLGCGTGLCGVEFAAHAKRMVGVDLAPRMLAKAKERGLYTDLIEGDVCIALQQSTQAFDLILSADVFIYIGKLEQVFSLASKQLNPGGLFAFSIEDNETDEDYRLTASGRYAQSYDYIQRLAASNGFKELSRVPVTLRMEKNVPAAGSIFVLRLTDAN